MIQDPSTIHSQFIAALSCIRQKWQEAANDTSLIQIEGNAGMLLADLISGIAFEPTEKIQILGPDLYKKIQDLLQSPIHN